MDLQTILLDSLLTIGNIGWLISALGTSLIIIFSIIKHINNRLATKADKEPLEKELRGIHKRINEKADKGKMDKMADQVNDIHSNYNTILTHILENK